jgi:hypothetical protein
MNIDALRPCYAESNLWDAFNPEKFTLCSPDPQAFRPPEENLNVLQVRLPTNFKAAAFHHAEDNAMLRRLQADIEAVRFTTDDGDTIELPVKLKVHDSVLCHWPNGQCWLLAIIAVFRVLKCGRFKRPFIPTLISHAKSITGLLTFASALAGASRFCSV